MAREGYTIRRQDNSDKVVPLWRTLPDGTQERITYFKSQEEMLKAMDSVHPDTGESLYAKSEVFRRSIEEILANTPAETVGVQLETRSPIPTDAEFLKGLKEDADRQRFNEMVDKAGGSDAVAKFQLAMALASAGEAEAQFFGDIHSATDPSVNRPMEAYLKERKAAGLGPDRQSIQVFDVRNDEYEAQKEQEALDFLASQDDAAL